MVYIHRVANKHGIYDVILDQFEDIADCSCLTVNSHKNNYVDVRLHHDQHWYPLSHLLVGDLPDGYQVDHMDRNPLNNTRCNLRIVTHQQNQMNRYTPNATGYAGVYKEKSGRFRSSVKINNKTCQVGTFDLPEEAAMCRDEAMDVIGKGFSIPNFEKSERCLTDVHMRQVAAFFNKHGIKV